MDAEEHAVWSREIEKPIGRSWLDRPWYFAESLFYLELLLAWGYYRESGIIRYCNPCPYSGTRNSMTPLSL